MSRFESQIDDNGWLWTEDHITAHEIKEFVESTKHKILGVVNESLSFNYDIQQYASFYTAPIIFEAQSKKIFRITAHKVDDVFTERCFNFVINKKQINRYYLIKFVEWFQLKSFFYTNSGIGNQADLKNELADIDRLSDIIGHGSQFKKLMLSISTLPINWFGSDQSANNCSVKNYGNGHNALIFADFLEPLMSKTAVSLISESAPTHDRCCHFTEKTAFCLASKCFPIWIGGFGCADALRDMGLDVFDDIIDHSYQYKPTLVERCYWAFASNLRMLHDLEFARHQRVKHRDRLQRNFDQCVPLISQYIDRQLESMPAAPGKIIEQMRKNYL
jgi:hypothetical protein